MLEWFQKEGLVLEEITANDLIDFVLYCRKSAVVVEWNNFLQVVRLKFIKEELLHKDPLLLECVKGMKKFKSLKKKDMELRLPLPVEALVDYCKKNSEKSLWLWMRNKALLSIGFRAMRRPCELGYLKKKHINFDGTFMHLRVPKSKTDQLGKGRWIPIDSTRGDACPVQNMKNWLEYNKMDKEDWLFPRENGASINSGDVNTLVKKVAVVAQLKGRYTGHSLRIGGATAALKGGLSIDQIRSIGDWTSDAVLFYLRANAVAEIKGSRRMGL
jgi:integrase